MKKAFLIVSILVMSLFLYSCSTSEKKNEINVESNVEKQNVEVKVDPFIFKINDVEIKMNEKAAPILEKLGKAKSEFVAPTCAFQGVDKVFTYSGFQVNTYQKDDVDYILGVLFIDDSVKTTEGLRLFEKIDKAKELYGDIEGKEGYYKYEKGDSSLAVVEEKGEIISIEYRAIFDAPKH